MVTGKQDGHSKSKSQRKHDSVKNVFPWTPKVCGLIFQGLKNTKYSLLSYEYVLYFVISNSSQRKATIELPAHASFLSL